MASVSNEIVMRLRMQGATVFEGEAKRASTSVHKIGTETEATGKKAEKSSKGFSKLAGSAVKLAAGYAAFTTAKTALTDSITGAVDLGEEINKTNVVFRKSGAGLVTWSKDSATAMGMSQAQALAAAGTFGNMLVPMGFARKRAADMSGGLVKLASDMSSFNNASPEATLDAVRAGLAGETEPLRRFGVFLNEARIKAEAMSMGLVKASKDTDKIKIAQQTARLATDAYREALKKHGKGSKEARRADIAMQRSQIALGKATEGTIPQLTAAQKAQATYALIMGDTKDAQGDFKRTSGSLANQQRILKAQYADLGAELGKNLLPALTKGAAILSTFMKHGELLATVMGSLTAAFIGYKIAVIAGIATTSTLMALWVAIPAAIAAVAIGLYIAYTRVKWFHNAVDAVFSWIKAHWPLLLYILAGPIGVGIGYVIKNFQSLRDKASSVLSFIRSIPGRISSAFSSLAGKIGGLATDFYNAGKKIGEAIVHGVTEFIRSAPGSIVDALAGIVPGGKVGKSILSHIPRPHIPHVGGATGGTITRAGRILVGERGPEVVSLQRDARIIPLPSFGGAAPAIAGGTTVAKFYLENRLVAQAVAQHTSDVMARR